MISIVIISKDEPALADTLDAVCAQSMELTEIAEVIVVDASEGRLDEIKRRYEDQLTWIQFERPSGVRIFNFYQRNAGVLAAGGEIKLCSLTRGA